MCAHQVSIFPTLFSISSESSAALRPRLVLLLQQNHHHHRTGRLLFSIGWAPPQRHTYSHPHKASLNVCGNGIVSHPFHFVPLSVFKLKTVRGAERTLRFVRTGRTKMEIHCDSTVFKDVYLLRGNECI